MKSTGLGNLIYHPQYAYHGTRYLRYAARHFRPIIFLLTAGIVAGTAWQYRSVAWQIPFGFMVALLLYSASYAWRRKMSEQRQRLFYRATNQFWRGQIAVIGVFFMVGLLAACDVRHHVLWLLYVMGTLIISEHNGTRAVVFTLLEVSAGHFLFSYGGFFFVRGTLPSFTSFLDAYPNILLQILSIWLVTFVFHYLVQNIHGRTAVFEMQQRWLNTIAEKWLLSEQPEVEEQELLNLLEERTGSHANLWRPELSIGALVDIHGESGDELISAAVRRRTTVLVSPSQVERVIRRRHLDRLGPLFNRITPLVAQARTGANDDALQILDLPLPAGVTARVAHPIFRLDAPQTVVGVLELSYPEPGIDLFVLERDIDALHSVADYARLLLLSTRKTWQLGLEKELDRRLKQHHEVSDLVRQVVEDVISSLGFSFCAVYQVDPNEEIIRYLGDKNAPWSLNAGRSLSSSDVKSVAVQKNQIFHSTRTYEELRDDNNWRKLKRSRRVCIWVPIPAANDDQSLGVIEAGFLPSEQTEVPADLVLFMERYAGHVGVALSKALLHQQEHELVSALQAMTEASHTIHEATTVLEPRAMIELIGQKAEKVLGADLVMIYLLDRGGHLSLPYFTPGAISGATPLTLDPESGILAWLLQEKRSHFISNARASERLVNVRKGRIDHARRTFTQRQNVKSFVSLPLFGANDELFGLLCLNFRRRHLFADQERLLCELFAKMAQVAFKETQFHRETSALATAAERERMAVELHHSLSQEFWALSNFTRAARAALERERWERVRYNLEEIGSVTNSAMDAFHQMQQTLREDPDREADFVDEVASHIERLKARHSATEFSFYREVEGRLPAKMQSHLARIAVEALNNAVRHARAGKIIIDYEVAPNGQASLHICDNGQGFDVAQARSAGRLGLSTMDYFAYQLNTQLEVESSHFSGTRIRVDVKPPHRRKEANDEHSIR